MKIILKIALFLVFTNLAISQVTLEWSARYNSPGNGDDKARDMDMDSAGNIYVAGWDGNPQGVVTIKYNSLGQQRWLSRFSNHLSIVSVPDKIKTDRFGNVYTMGHDSHGFIIKYDSTGVEKWVAQFSQFNAVFGDIAVSKSGFIYAAGSTPRSNLPGDILLVKYNPQGDTIWLRTFNIPNNKGAGASTVYVDDSNYVYLAGVITMKTPVDTVNVFCTMKYDSLGVMKWMSYYKSNIVNRGGYATKIKGDKRGNLYVTGCIEDSTPARHPNYCTIKYSNDGTQKWVNIYEGIVYGGGTPKDMVVDSIGNVYVTGRSPDTGSIFYSYATLKYDTAGVQKWVRRFSSIGIQDNFPSSIFLDKLQNCYITGSFSTVKYDSSGSIKWVLENPDPQSSYRYHGVKIIVDKNNNIFLTAVGDINDYDILTLKYSQLTNVISPGFISIQSYSLSQNYPNPFNPTTKIKFSVQNGFPIKTFGNDKVVLKVYDMLGREVITLVNEALKPGIYEVIFDGSKLPTGIYLYTLFANGNKIDTKKLVLIK